MIDFYEQEKSLSLYKAKNTNTNRENNTIWSHKMAAFGGETTLISPY